MPYTLLCASQRVFNKPRFQDVYVWAGRATFHNPVPHCRAARIIFGCCAKSQELSRSNGVPNTLHVGQRKQDIVPGAGSPLTVPLHRIPEQTEASARSLTSGQRRDPSPRTSGADAATGPAAQHVSCH